MTFMHPAIAAAAATCVAVPILIHLLSRRRRRPIVWGAMRFLLEAHRKQRRRLQIEQILLLATRCLIILLAGAAIARPLLEALGALGGGSARTVYLVIDNSLASGAQPAAGSAPALERLRAQAADMLGALGPSDRAALITLASPAEAHVLPPSPDLATIRAMVERLSPTDAPADWAGAAQRIAADIASSSSEAESVVMIFSDFLAGSLDPGLPAPRAFEALPASLPVRVVASRPMEPAEAPGNVQVTAVEPLRPVVLTASDTPQLSAPGGQEQVRVALRRTGSATREAATTTLRLSLVAPGAARSASGPRQARAAVRWTAGQEDASAMLTIDPGDLTAADLASAALIAEIDADALPGDNAFRRPVAVRDAIRAGIVDQRRFGSARLDRLGAGDWLRLALRPGGGAPIETTDISPASLDAASIAGLDAVFLPRPDLLEPDAWQRLRRFVDAGGLLVVCPPAETPVHVWPDAMARSMGISWRVAREPRQYDKPQHLADEQPTSSLLALVQAELSELIKPVTVSRTLPIEEPAPGARVLLRLADGSAWLVASNPGSTDAQPTPLGASPSPRPHETTSSADAAGGASAAGGSGAGLILYLASAPTLSWTDAPAKPFMVPLVQEIARQGVGESLGAWTQTAGAQARAPRRASELVEVRDTGERVSIRVDAAGRSAEPIRRAGLFRAMDERGQVRALVAVNADAAAGRTDAQSPAAVQSWLAQAFGRARGDSSGPAAGPDASPTDAVMWLDRNDPAKALAAPERGSPFSLPLLIAAAALLLLETMMARWFSHAVRDDEPAGNILQGLGADTAGVEAAPAGRAA